jgi:hypothetical protein
MNWEAFFGTIFLSMAVIMFFAGVFGHLGESLKDSPSRKLENLYILLVWMSSLFLALGIGVLV